jgi:DnaJ-domain-containing protein 1
MQEYHPDKVSSLGPKLREVAEAEAQKINAAYEFFTRKYGPSA